MAMNVIEGRKARTSGKRPDVAPETYTLAVTARKFGIGYTAFREAAIRDELPVRPIRIGGRWLFPRSEVDRVLGIEPESRA